MFQNIAAVIAEIKAMEAEMKKKDMLRDSATGKYHPYTLPAASTVKLPAGGWEVAVDDFAGTIIGSIVEKPKSKLDVQVLVVKDKFLPNVGGNPEVQKANRLIMAHQLALKLIEDGLVEFETTPPVQEGDRWEASAKISVVVKRAP